MKQYSTAIADAIKSLFDELDMNYFFDEDEGYFKFVIQISSKFKTLRYLISVRDNDFIMNALCPIEIDPEDSEIRRTLSEYLCRINDHLCQGSFILDFSDGSILFRVFFDCTDNSLSAKEKIKKSLSLPAAMFTVYERGIIDVVYNDSTAEKAASNYKPSNIQDMMGSTGSDPDEKKATPKHDRSEHIKVDPFKKGGNS